MKRIIIFFTVLLFTLCNSLVFAYSFGMSNEDILDLFDAISFDYTQLTSIDTNQAKKNLEIILESDYVNGYETFYNNYNIEECLSDVILNYGNFTMTINENEKKEYDCFLLKKLFEFYDGNENAMKSEISNYKFLQELNKRKKELDRTIVGILYINSDGGNNYTHDSSVGSTQGLVGHHSWITFNNVTNTPQTFGGCTVAPYTSYTVGTWQTSIHNGIFYNFESYYNDLNEFDPYSSSYLSIAVTDTSLVTINDYITNSNNDCWYFWKNCVNFAEGLWNSVASSTNQVSGGVGPIKTPIILKNSIDSKISHYSSFVIPASGNGYYYGGAFPIIFIPDDEE